MSSDRDEHASDGSREMAADIMATSTTKLKLFHSIRLARLVRSCFIFSRCSASPVKVRGISPSSKAKGVISPEHGQKHMPGIASHADQPFMERNRVGPSRRVKKEDKQGLTKMLSTRKKIERNLNSGL